MAWAVVLFVTRAMREPDLRIKHSSTPCFIYVFAIMVHIGEAIKKELQKRKRSISWLARKLYCDRSNVYDIFKRRSIDTELLLRISLVLDYNFFDLYTKDFYADRV